MPPASRHTRTVPSAPPLTASAVPSSSTPNATADSTPSWPRSGSPTEVPSDSWGRNLLADLAWHAGDAGRIVAEIQFSQRPSGQADPALASRAEALLANAASRRATSPATSGTAGARPSSPARRPTGKGPLSR
jgi:hypothetical protein